MKTKDYKQHAWARWLYSLCLIIVLTAVPRTARSEVLYNDEYGMGYITGMSVKPTSVGLGTTAYEVTVPMTSSDKKHTWTEFEIQINDKTAATMADLGYGVATGPTNTWELSLFGLNGYTTYPSSWNSARPTSIQGKEAGVGTSTYGRLQFYACGSAVKDNKATITIVPERMYTAQYLGKETVTVRVIGKSVDVYRDMAHGVARAVQTYDLKMFLYHTQDQCYQVAPKDTFPCNLCRLV